MKLHVSGKGPIELSQSDFLSSGGEGSIYVKGSKAYKIYLDPKKMIPAAKIQELSVIQDDSVIKPEDILLEQKGRTAGFVPVGYSMRYVTDTYALCQLFTKSFRERNNISPDASLNLVRKLQTITQHVHESNILIVDLNELNFLTSKDFKDIFAIDVDSYQTKSFPATAIMDSIRDRHTNGFSQLTDWFSFAIVAFQLLIGIHPYKGKHDKYKTIEERMQRNISVLNKDVRIPAACYPISLIPKVYLDWFAAVLDQGKRIPPPQDLHAVITLIQTIQRITGSNNFDIQEYLSLDSNIDKLIFIPGNHIVQTKNNLYIGKRSIPLAGRLHEALITTVPNNLLVSARVDKKKLILHNESATSEIPIDIRAEWIVSYDNRLYIKSEQNILEINLTEISHKEVMATSKVVAKVLPSATIPHDGLIIQDILGTYYASVFPHKSHHQCIRLEKLSGYKIIRARYQKRVLMVIAQKDGKYDRFIIRLENDDYNTSYDVRVIKDIDPMGLNFVVLDNGFCVSIDDEKMEIFSARKDGTYNVVVEDPDINWEMKLYGYGTRLYFTTYADPGKVFSISMKKKGAA